MGFSGGAGYEVSPANSLNKLRESLAGYFTPVNLLIMLALVVSYFLTGKLGVALASPAPGATAVWLPAGIALAAVLLRGNRVWPGIFLGAFLINFTNGAPVFPSLGIAISSTLEAVLAAYLVNRFADGVRAFFQARSTLRFLFLAGVFSTACCATIGGLLIYFGGHSNGYTFAFIWRTWWVGDMLGMLLLTPFLVLLLGHEHHSLALPEMAELTLLLTCICIVCVFNFGPPLFSWIPRSGLHYLCVPLLAWIAVRFCPLEASGAVLLLGGFAMWGSLHGFGLFANSTGLPFLGAGYVALLSATTLAVAAVSVEQKKHLEDALQAYYILKGRYESEMRAPSETQGQTLPGHAPSL